MNLFGGCRPLSRHREEGGLRDFLFRDNGNNCDASNSNAGGELQISDFQQGSFRRASATRFRFEILRFSYHSPVGAR